MIIVAALHNIFDCFIILIQTQFTANSLPYYSVASCGDAAAVRQEAVFSHFGNQTNHVFCLARSLPSLTAINQIPPSPSRYTPFGR